MKLINKIKELFFGKEAVLFFGRCNPPHRGHEEIMKRMQKYCREHDCEGYFVFSATQDNTNNPLDKYFRALLMFPLCDTRLEIAVADEFHPTIFHWLSYLYHGKGIRRVTIFCGSDRSVEYQTKLDKYNDGKPNSHGSYKFKKLKVDYLSRADYLIASSDMRVYARKGWYDLFKAALPSWLSEDEYLAREVYDEVRKGLQCQNLKNSSKPYPRENE